MPKTDAPDLISEIMTALEAIRNGLEDEIAGSSGADDLEWSTLLRGLEDHVNRSASVAQAIRDHFHGNVVS